MSFTFTLMICAAVFGANLLVYFLVRSLISLIAASFIAGFTLDFVMHHFILERKIKAVDRELERSKKQRQTIEAVIGQISKSLPIKEAKQ